MPLNNCEINLILNWSENCVITSKATRDADPDTDPAVAAVNNPTNATFEIKDAKLYVPVVTLSTEDDNKLLEQLKTGFKITIKWNKYRSKMTKQAKTTHPARGRCEDVVATSFCPFQQRRRYVSNETPNDVSVERRQDISVVRLHDVFKECRDNVSMVRNNDTPLVRLHGVSN